MDSGMPDFSSLLHKPILTKSTINAFPVVRQIEKPLPAVQTKASAKELLYKMQTTKVRIIIRAYRGYKLRSVLRKRTAARKISRFLKKCLRVKAVRTI